MKARDFPLIGIPTGWKTNAPEIVNEERIVARAGTKIVCPRCKDVIGRVSIDIYSGMRVRADAIEFEQGQKRHPNQKAECGKCSAPYMKHKPVGRTFKTFVHTEIGWI